MNALDEVLQAAKNLGTSEATTLPAQTENDPVGCCVVNLGESLRWVLRKRHAVLVALLHTQAPRYFRRRIEFRIRQMQWSRPLRRRGFVLP